MSDNNTNHGAPTHWFFESEATNFLFAHLFGLMMSLILTTLFGVLITSNIVIITLVFLIIEFFVASSIEGTKTSIKILKWDPVLFMGKLTGKYSGSGTYRQVWPWTLNGIEEELVSEEPIFFYTAEIMVMSHDNLKLKGGKATVSYKVNLSSGKKFTRNTKENLEATLTGRLKQELTTLIGQSDFATDSSVVNGHNVRKNLEELAKKLPKETDINDLVESSGVKMLQITIEAFVPEDEEDKDALAKKARQKAENEGEVQKADLIAKQFAAIKKGFEEAGVKMSDQDIKDIWDQKFGTKTKIDTGGAPIWGVGTPGK